MLQLELHELVVQLLIKQMLDVSLIDQLRALRLRTRDWEFAVIDLGFDELRETLGMEEVLTLCKWYNFVL